MGAPYVSIRRLVANLIAAMLAAIEAYEEQQMTYRDEGTVVFAVNAWELALKATLPQTSRTILYPKNRGEKCRSIGLGDALHRIASAASGRPGLTARR